MLMFFNDLHVLDDLDDLDVLDVLDVLDHVDLLDLLDLAKVCSEKISLIKFHCRNGYDFLWDWIGLYGNLCVGLFYEHCFAVLITCHEMSTLYNVQCTYENMFTLYIQDVLKTEFC